MNLVNWYAVSCNAESGIDNRIIKDEAQLETALQSLWMDQAATRIDVLDVNNGYSLVSSHTR